MKNCIKENRRTTNITRRDEFSLVKEYGPNWRLISYFSAEPASLENFFKMLSGYSSIFYEKQKQTMTPPIRKFYAVRFENFLKDFIEIIPFLMKIHPDSTDIINQKIETFLRIHLKKSTSSSLAQICWKMTNTNP